MNAPVPHHYEVDGPGRDYDYALFCEEHNNEATDFAAEWLAERFDMAEVGEEVSVQMRVVEGLIDPDCYCVACEPARGEEVAP